MLLMTLDEMCGAFEGLLCRYGGGLKDWPEDVQPVLLRYLRQSYDARRRVVEMRRMEEMLREDPPDQTPPDGLEDRIIDAMLKLRAQ
jgi:hypothetical protein